jgi:hypothetical protein
VGPSLPWSVELLVSGEGFQRVFILRKKRAQIDTLRAHIHYSPEWSLVNQYIKDSSRTNCYVLQYYTPHSCAQLTGFQFINFGPWGSMENQLSFDSKWHGVAYSTSLLPKLNNMNHPKPAQPTCSCFNSTSCTLNILRQSDLLTVHVHNAWPAQMLTDPARSHPKEFFTTSKGNISWI